MNPCHILIVNDDKTTCEFLRVHLEAEGYKVDFAPSAETALSSSISNYNLIISEVLLSGTTGFKFAHTVRNTPRTANIPIIFLTSRDQENDRITGFSVGADDYITQPYSVRELIARINAIFRRISERNSTESNEIVFDKLELNLTNKQVIVKGREIQFTKKEFEILKLFLENKNAVFSRDEILSRIWSEDSFVMKRTIDVNITRIRKKIGEYERNIVSRPGIGYCFEG